jgi:hypothetical protein
MTMWNVIVFLFLAIPPGSKSGGWDKLYETPAANRWVFAVWLAGDGSWRAASNHVILTADAHGRVSTTELGDDDVYVFGEDGSGAVIAAGSRQAIWEEGAHGFKRVHERVGAPTKGREAHHDVIDRLGYFDPDHPDRLYALASLAFALWRGPGEAWQLAQDDRATRRAVDGPGVRPAEDCRVSAWTWLDRKDGVLECEDRRGYLYSGTTMVAPLSPMPAACKSEVIAIVRDGDELFASCGRRGEVWRVGVRTAAWTTVSGIAGVQSLQARGGCLLAGTKRAVYRRCDAR